VGPGISPLNERVAETMVSATTLEEHRAALTGRCSRMLGSVTGSLGRLV